MYNRAKNKVENKEWKKVKKSFLINKDTGKNFKYSAFSFKLPLVNG